MCTAGVEKSQNLKRSLDFCISKKFHSHFNFKLISWKPITYALCENGGKTMVKNQSQASYLYTEFTIWEELQVALRLHHSKTWTASSHMEAHGNAVHSHVWDTWCLSYLHLMTYTTLTPSSIFIFLIALLCRFCLS